jgi:NitT/TauT family transport system substrate-binding protein
VNRFLLSTLAVIALLATFGCERVGNPSPAPGAERITIRVLTQPYISFLPIFIAEEEGCFRDEGIDVEYVPVMRPQDGLPLLVQDKIDVYTSTPSIGIFNCIARGADIRIVVGKGYAEYRDGSYTGFVVRRELLESGKLDDPENWKGLKFDTNPDPEFKNFLLARLLKTSGLRMEDVQVTPVPTPADCEALRTGALDVVVTGEPWIARMVLDGYGAMWMPTEKIYPDFQVAFLMYGRNLLRENREAGDRFMRAYLKAIRLYNQGKTERNVQIAMKYTGLDEKIVRAAAWPPVRENGQINAQSLLDFQAWAMEVGALDSVVPVERFWDPGFLDHRPQPITPRSGPQN